MNEAPIPAPDVIESRPTHSGLLRNFVIDVIALTVFTTLGISLVMLVLYVTGHDTGRVPEWFIELSTMLAMLAALLMLDRVRPLSKRGAVVQPRMSSAKAFGVGLAAGVLTLAVGEGLSWLAPQLGLNPIASNEASVRAMLAQSPWFGLLLIGIGAPVVEELLLRRRLFAPFIAAQRFWLGLLVTSVLFAALHEFAPDDSQRFGDWVYLMAIYTLMGGAFAGVYAWTGRIGAAITTHAVNNLVLCLWILSQGAG